MSTDKDKALAALSRSRGSQQRGDEVENAAAEATPKVAPVEPQGSKQASLQASKQAKKQIDVEPQDPLRPFSSYLPMSLQKRLKLYAVQNETTVTTVLEEAVREYIDREQE
jgi:hypothetical protein